ncbi:MAG: tRNA uridine-5-carboxymethylaminomethyl(34) synthesis GTPase MnmE [bacterium]
MHKNFMLNGTIVAVSTPFGESGIGIIRMSGEDSLLIADKVFRRRDNKGVFELRDHSINYGWIIDPKSGEFIDEVLLSVMKKPKTYTKEDIVEINCHGGWFALNRTMDLLISFGARIALPGEFTKRAFINGRIDLTQAEAVIDIIRSKSEIGLCSAVKRLKGTIKNEIEDIREKLLQLLSYINAGIDFCEQVQVEKQREKKIIDDLIGNIKNLVERSDKKRGIEEGLKVVICGKTNVGKSSILNAIYGEKRILTSRISGTTRDSIQIDIYFDGITYHFIDTAGIREGKTKLERVSIKNSKKQIKNSDYILVIFDISRKLDRNDKKIVEWINKLKKEVIWVVNKTDLKARLDLHELKLLIKNNGIIMTCTKNYSGIDKILSELKKKKQNISEQIVNGLLINKRQRNLLTSVAERLNNIKDFYKNGLNDELISEELKYSLKDLDCIIGKELEEIKIEEVFNQFCIGK